MTSRKNIIYRFFSVILLSKGVSDINVVSYGWEVFERNSNSRTLSLAQSSIGYPTQNPGAVLLNPALSLGHNNMIGLTHQSKMSGTSNSEIIGFDKYINDSSWVSVVILYEGVDGIPDTRGALLDWGLDGVFGTFDVGEGNGSLDEGERLDVDKIRFFNQNIFGLLSRLGRFHFSLVEFSAFDISVHRLFLVFLKLQVLKCWICGLRLHFCLNH